MHLFSVISLSFILILKFLSVGFSKVLKLVHVKIIQKVIPVGLALVYVYYTLILFFMFILIFALLFPFISIMMSLKSFLHALVCGLVYTLYLIVVSTLYSSILCCLNFLDPQPRLEGSCKIRSICPSVCLQVFSELAH